jgi:Mlc titration factor MtfA (ptsG expression regulator)
VFIALQRNKPVAEFILYSIILLWALSRYYWYFNLPDTEVYAEFSNIQFNEYDAILESRMPYYQKLSDAGKAKFIGRLVYIMDKVPIIGREEFEVNTPEKVFILASLTQLTFGFSKPHIPFLKGIVVYPDVFYSKLLKAWVKGLSMGNGMVFLSYNHFAEGYKDTKDTYNLGLHEFAHVLRFQANELSLFDERLSAYFSEWEELGTPVFMQTRTRQEDFFRAYGGTNTSEFFSVCVENFFEVPELFKQELPELYYHLCYLLKQSPLNETSDYIFHEHEIAEANHLLKTDLPIYKLWNSQRELIFIESMDTFIALLGVVAVLIFIGTTTEHQLATLRLLFCTSVIFLGVRAFYYRNIKAVFNKRYGAYFFLKLIPVLAFLVIVFAAG